MLLNCYDKSNIMESNLMNEIIIVERYWEQLTQSNLEKYLKLNF